MRRIGVEPALSNVKNALQEMGHEVVDIRSEDDAAGCETIIISGTDKDMMGIANVAIDGSVINANGATTEEVCQMVEERLQ